MRKKIEAEFTLETGIWSDEDNTFINRSKFTHSRVIEMEVIGDLLVFYGSPADHKRYCAEDIIWGPPKRGKLCICEGVINERDTCTVPFKDVYEFIAEEYAK